MSCQTRSQPLGKRISPRFIPLVRLLELMDQLTDPQLFFFPRGPGASLPVETLCQAFGGKYAAKFDSTVYLAGSMEQDFREALVASSAAAVPASTK